MHYFDLDLGPVTLVLKLDLDMLVTYLMLKIRSIGQVIQKLSSGYTDRQTRVKPLATRIHGQ